MATPFLQRFYDEVSDNLGDPSTSKRLPNSARYRDLCRVQERVFQHMLNAAGVSSEVGRTELVIPIVAEQEYYDLPPLFRQFLSFERRDDGDPRIVTAWVGSLGTYQPGPGIRLLGEGRGFQFVPKPSDAFAGDWTLVYRRGPAKLHYAQLSSLAVDGSSFVLGTPGSDQGEVVALPNYYAGCTFRIYSSTKYAGQDRVCTRNTVNASTGAVTVYFENTPFNPVPTGTTLLYEVRPDLAESVDGIYAYDVAIMNGSRRITPKRTAMLRQDRHDLWLAARGIYVGAVADRPPERSRPPRHDEDDPYE